MPTAPPQKFSDHFRRLGWRFWIGFLVACVIVEGGEFLADRALESADEGAVAHTLFGAAGIYQRAVNMPRSPIDRYTAIVEINPKDDTPDVSQHNVCDEREFVATLIERIASASPALIAIDKYFGRDTCKTNVAGTRHLIQTIANTRMTLPVIVGLHAAELTAEQQRQARATSALDPPLSFGDGSDGGLREAGLLNIAHDNRQLPLEWLVYGEPDDPPNRKDPLQLDTLAFAVAKAFDPHLLDKSPRLKRILDEGEQPFIGFIGKQDFRYTHFYAGDVVCGPGRVRPSDVTNCLAGKRPAPVDLRNKIVLIAENDSSEDVDVHESVIGKVPGFYLQANYIEGLLDDRYYPSAGRFADYGFGFLFLFAMELILVVYEEEPLSAVMWIAGLIVLGFALIFLVTMNLRVYLNPVPVAGVAILIKSGHIIFGSLAKFAKKREEAKQEDLKREKTGSPAREAVE